MISIKRRATPAFLNKPEFDFSENDYSNPEVRSALKDMQINKCCYCERSFKELTETEIEGEHYIPRTSERFKDQDGQTQWHFVNRWENLLLACRSCNSKKSAKSPFDGNGNRVIIDPSDDSIDPENEIKFNLKDDILSFYDEEESTDLGRSTIEKIRLSSNKLLIGKFRKCRAEINNHFDELIEAIENQDNNSIIESCNQIRDITKSSTPFAAYCRAVVKKRIAKLQRSDLRTLTNYYDRNFSCPEIDLFSGHNK